MGSFADHFLILIYIAWRMRTAIIYYD